MTAPVDSTDQEKAELAELEAQIAAEEAKADEVARRRKPSALDAKKAELAAAKRAREQAEVLERLEGKYGLLNEKIATLYTPSGEMVVVKKPEQMAYRRFIDQGDKIGSADCDKLNRQCVLHPPKDVFAALCEEFPALTTKAANAACSLAGLGGDSAQGK